MPGIGIGLGLGMGAGRAGGGGSPSSWAAARSALRSYLTSNFGQPNPRSQPVMSSPPSVTATQAKPDGLTIDYLYKDGASLTYLGGGEQTYLDDYRLAPEATQSTTAGIAGDGLSTYTWRISATVDADRLGIGVLGSPFAVRLIIDGQYVDRAGHWTETTSGLNWFDVDFGSKAERHVVVEMGLHGAFYGFSVAAGGTVSAGPSTGKRMIVLGDSITVGTGADLHADGWANVCGDWLGIDDVWSCGVGGGGYVSTNGGLVYKLSEHLGDANDNGPWDVIIVALGANDVGLDEDAQVTAEATACLTSLREHNPTAQILVIGPWNPDAPEAPSADYLATRAAIVAGIPSGLGIDFLDPQAVEYDKYDTIHPSTSGHGTLGLWSAYEVAAAIGVNISAPVNVTPPEVTGVPQVGELLTCDPGTYSAIPPPEFSYQWTRDGDPITGATLAHYLLVDADEGAAIRCDVDAENGLGSITTGSNTVGPVAAGTEWNPVALSPVLAFDPAQIETMYQDHAGTTPVTASGDRVGAILSVATGSAVGAELVSNGDGSSTSGWTAGTGISMSIVDGALRFTRGATMNEQIYQGVATEIGKTYRWRATFKARSTTAGNLRLECRAGETPTTGGVFSSLFPDVGATVSRLFTATSTTTYLRFLIRDGASGDWIEIDDVSCAEVVGLIGRPFDADARPQYLSGPPRLVHDVAEDNIVVSFAEALDDCTVAYAVPGVGALVREGQSFGTGNTVFIQDHCWMGVFDPSPAGSDLHKLTAWLNARSQEA